MTKPLISLDIETNCLEPWRPGSEIVSIGLVWDSEDGQQELFVKGEPEIREILLRLQASQSPILVYNQSFEQTWFQYKYPDIKLNWALDAMRLVQLAGTSFDSGGMTVEIDGFGLKPAVVRILGIAESWTDEIYDHLSKQFGVPKSKAAAYLGMAPDELLKPYNLADCIYTLKLYKFLDNYFKKVNFDWRPDHQLYQGVVQELVNAQVMGFKVDRDGLRKYIQDLETEITEIDDNFLLTYETEIRAVRERLRVKEQAKFKKKIVTEAPEFNTGSRQHLKMLIVDELGIKPIMFSPTGEPSFKSSHMHLYGEPGDLLSNRGKRAVIKGQAEALLRVSELDGLLHPQLKAVGTFSGRFAGSSGLNMQGVSRNEQRFMEFFKAPDGYTMVEIDAISAEATITAAYSNDPVYKFQVFEGSGIKPYYREDGLLMISDPYIALTSVSTVGSKELYQVFNTELFDGLTFAEQWVEDPEVVKSHPVVKKFRKINKMLSLALSYGLGAKKLQKQVAEQFGVEVSETTAKKVVKAYWAQYKDIKEFAEKCAYRIQQSGAITNQFGYRVTPTEHKAFNYLIQSTMSGVVNYKILLLRELCDYWKMYTVIHDAIIVIVPSDKVEEFKEISKKTDTIINENLRWSVDVRFGFSAGRNLWETK